jgi:hypothetical protein
MSVITRELGVNPGRVPARLARLGRLRSGAGEGERNECVLPAALEAISEHPEGDRLRSDHGSHLGAAIRKDAR